MSKIKLTEAREKAEQARKQIEDARQQRASAIRDALEEGFTPIFDEFPFLGSIAWTQYRPYFNDGDLCVFSSQFTEPSLNSLKDIEDGTAVEYGYENGEDFNVKSGPTLGWGANERPNPDFDPQYEACNKAVQEFCSLIAGDETRSYSDATPTTFDSALQQLFGDHAQITVTREGIEVDHYEHE